MVFEEIDRKLEKLKIFYKKEEPLAFYTTIKIGGKCKRMLFPDTEEKLISILDFLEIKEIPFFVIGGGSKLLISDKEFNGVVINLRELKEIKIIKKNDKKLLLKGGVGTKISQIISFGIKEGFGGLEFLAGVPASIGGAIKMNAGAFEKSISQLIKTLKIYKNKNIKTLISNENLWNYRTFKEPGIIISAELELIKREKKEIKNLLKTYIEKRKKTQPLFEKTFGSVFKNPPSHYAGKLIEKCGLKGYQIGNAKISEQHANFIVNLGNAKFEDVLALIKLIQDKVFSKFGILLEPEVNIIENPL